MAMLSVAPGIEFPEEEVAWQAIRAQGAGGQNVNKVSSAVHLRFDIRRSSLPEDIRQQLLTLSDRRISREGIVIIKAQRFRTREKNRADAIERLLTLIRKAADRPKPRRATRPTRASQRRRLDSKSRHGRLKQLRRTVEE